MSSALACLLAVVMATTGPTQDDEWAREVAEQAARDIGRGDYDVATDRLEEAYAKKPLPAFLFMLARIEETQGDCEGAIPHYERFLQSEVPLEDEREARAGLQRCREALEAEADKNSEEGSDEGPTDTPPIRPWYADPLGGTATVLGVVGVGVGAGLLIQAQSDRRAADDAGSLGSFDRHARRAETWSQAGVITLSVGAGLLLVGIIRYAVVGARNRRIRLNADGVAVRF
jgi:hypothetical protein